MSAKAPSITHPVVSVPVDRLDVVNGPGLSIIDSIKALLAIPGRVVADFTFKTEASERTFTKSVPVKYVGKCNPARPIVKIAFEFCGVRWTGWYNMHNRRGRFNPDL